MLRGEEAPYLEDRVQKTPPPKKWGAGGPPLVFAPPFLYFCPMSFLPLYRKRRRHHHRCEGGRPAAAPPAGYVAPLCPRGVENLIKKTPPPKMWGRHRITSCPI